MNVYEKHAMIFDALSRVMAKGTDPAEEARLTKLARDVDRRMKEAKRRVARAVRRMGVEVVPAVSRNGEEPGRWVARDGRVWSDRSSRWLSENNATHVTVGRSTISRNRLVLMSWIGPAPAGHVACRRDRKPAGECSLKDLYWGTPASFSREGSDVDKREALCVWVLHVRGHTCGWIAYYTGMSLHVVKGIVAGGSHLDDPDCAPLPVRSVQSGYYKGVGKVHRGKFRDTGGDLRAPQDHQ